jgi:hypothetical protein
MEPWTRNQIVFHHRCTNALHGWYKSKGDYPSLWACIESIAPKIGCGPQTRNDWVKQQEIDTGSQDGLN